MFVASVYERLASRRVATTCLTRHPLFFESVISDSTFSVDYCSIYSLFSGKYKYSVMYTCQIYRFSPLQFSTVYKQVLINQLIYNWSTKRFGFLHHVDTSGQRQPEPDGGKFGLRLMNTIDCKLILVIFIVM
jgi:hypothetical protein